MKSFLFWLPMLGLMLSTRGWTAETPPHGFNPAYLDTGVKPCEDFYAFACNGWQKDFHLPPGYSRLSLSTYVIDKHNDEILKGVLEGYARGLAVPDVPFHQAMGDYYATCLDQGSAEKASRDELPRALDSLDTIRDRAQLQRRLAAWFEEGVDAFFSYGATQDSSDATRMIATFAPGGMGLPSRDYYLDPAKAELRAKYVAHIARSLELSGESAGRAAEEAGWALEIETALAKVELPPEQQRDPQLTNHPMDLAGVGALAPGVDWEVFLSAIGSPRPQKVNVSEPAFLKTAAALIARTPLPHLKAYLRWRYLAHVAPTLGRALDDEHFAFYGKILNGQEAPFPREKRCVDAVTAALPFALGKAYTALAFGESSKSEARALAAAIRGAMAQRLESESWMDGTTRAAALEKLRAVTAKIGYPDKDTDYSSLKVAKQSYLQNFLSASRFAGHHDLTKINRPVDPFEWSMYPHQVNAYYSPSSNEIAFPAAILQPPFFDVSAPLGQNYGSIGAVIGHELTHGFDDEGHQYDARGNLRNWWTPSVEEAFRQKADCLVRQYDAYPVGTGVHLNGKLTLGENIADLGGIKLAFDAFQAARQGHEPAAKVAGFDEEQQFFLAYAQSWCEKNTPEAEDNQAKSNPHSTGKYRVNGVVANLPQFERAFGCPAGAPMAPKERCEIW